MCVVVIAHTTIRRQREFLQHNRRHNVEIDTSKYDQHDSTNSHTPRYVGAPNCRAETGKTTNTYLRQTTGPQKLRPQACRPQNCRPPNCRRPNRRRPNCKLPNLSLQNCSPPNCTLPNCLLPYIRRHNSTHPNHQLHKHVRQHSSTEQTCYS